MKSGNKFGRYIAALGLGLMLSIGWAVTLSAEQKEVKQLMTKMYSYSIDTFEFGRFNKKYDPAQGCKLLSQYFDMSLLVPNDRREPCELGGRYAVGSSELLSDMRDTHLPTKIGTPVVEHDVATVEIITDLSRFSPPENVGRIVFFLNKKDVGWRIVNSLYFRNWPITDGKCWGDFGLPPTPWQKQFEAPQCKPGFVDKEIH